jgi:hypothetical protein
VPWFFTNMPDAYFLQVPDESQRQHLRAIVAMQVSQTLTVPEIMLSSESDLGYGVQYTFIHSGATERVAPRQLESLPDGTLTRVLLTTTRDGRLSLNSFDVAPNSRWRSASAARRLEQASNGVQAVGDGLKRFVVGAGASPAEQEALARHTEYNERLEAGDLTAHAGTPMKGSRPPASFTERPTILHLPLDEFLRRCSSTYVTHQLPRLLVKQRARTTHVTVSNRPCRHASIVHAGGRALGTGMMSRGYEPCMMARGRDHPRTDRMSVCRGVPRIVCAAQTISTKLCAGRTTWRSRWKRPRWAAATGRQWPRAARC